MIHFKLLIVVLLLGVSGCNRDNMTAKIAEQEKQDNEAKKAVAELAKRSGATTDWEEKLSKGEVYRSLLTYEVENVWVGQTILFIGNLKDIATASPDSYRLKFDKAGLVTDHDFETGLGLSLTAPKNLIAPFLAKHPNLVGDDLFNGIAIVAKVNSVSSERKMKDDQQTDFRIGHGELVDLLFIGSASLSKPMK